MTLDIDMENETVGRATMIIGGILASLGLVFGLPFIAAVLGVGALAGGYTLQSRKTSSDVLPNEDDGEDWEALPENNLADLNLKARRRAGDLPEDLLADIEDAIDSVRTALKNVRHTEVGAEEEYAIEQMAQEYLPNLLERYLDLDAEEMREQQQRLKEDLNRMHTKIQEIKDDESDGSTTAFEQESQFVRERFEPSSNGAGNEDDPNTNQQEELTSEQ